ncbi:hypothetical protein CYMTET_43192 [Cymbomonas tetramitiformis]|uniref:Uncharacterized protein n=1 Tax=Cymbomonas tetramitiformis TaxID=36881 RepID=A0AAE0C4K1_9CHLO|nr:hypothetical protein CYMTET_43192 [Cymbomonas tetramitiformis]
MCVIEQADDADGLVSAFQTAFDSEDDASFARLCARHDRPLVRQDEEPFTFAENVDVGLRAQWLVVPTRHPNTFPWNNSRSATPAVIDEPAVGPEPRVAIETDEDSGICPQQYIDNEPPFEQSFKDKMYIQPGFDKPEQHVSANSFTPLAPWISSTHDSAGIADYDSRSLSLTLNLSLTTRTVRDDVPPPALPGRWCREADDWYMPHGSRVATCQLCSFICMSMCFMHTATASALSGVEIAPRSVVYGHHSVYQNGAVNIFIDTAFLDSGTADFDNDFNLDSDYLDSEYFDIYNLDFEIENNNNYNFCELYPVDHFQGG